MINAIIFSKNRASQLRLCLESINKNAKDIFNITVIYTSTDKEFESGYDKLKLENLSQGVKWIQQTDFKNNILQALQTNADLSCFGTDDDIFYKDFDVNKIIETIKNDQDVFNFSLRLGKNTKFCYTMNTTNILHAEILKDGVITWDWSKHYLDYGYPLSVDFHIFRTKDIMRLVKNVSFKNPNEFEASLQIFDTYPKFKMAAFENSVLVNSPTNKVQNTFDNLSGQNFGISAKELNNKYLNGEVIDLDSLDFSNIVGCHQELELRFKEIK